MKRHSDRNRGRHERLVVRPLERPVLPHGLARSRWLDYYAERFPTVEVNYSFYRLPSQATVRGWRRRAPAGFRYAVKGSRFVTHFKRLVGVEDSVQRFFDRIDELGVSLGPALWQLPPDLQEDGAVLEAFLSSLPGSRRHAVEFRHPSWLTEATFGFPPRARGRVRARCTLAADATKVRGYRGASSTPAFTASQAATPTITRSAELRPFARFLADAGVGYAYFNNDENARAPKNAAELVELLGDAALRS